MATDWKEAIRPRPATLPAVAASAHGAVVAGDLDLGGVSAVGYGRPAGGALVLLGCVQCLVR